MRAVGVSVAVVAAVVLLGAAAAAAVYVWSAAQVGLLILTVLGGPT